MSKRLEAVSVQLSVSFAILRVKRRKLNDFEAKIARVILKVTRLKRCGLLVVALISKPIIVLSSLALDHCPVVAFLENCHLCAGP